MNKIPTPNGLADEYKAGASTVSLGIKYSVSAMTIARMLEEVGIPRRQPQKKIPTPDGLADEYKAGATLVTLAKRYKVGTNTIKRMLLEQGVKIRQQGPQTEPQARPQVQATRQPTYHATNPLLLPIEIRRRIIELYQDSKLNMQEVVNKLNTEGVELSLNQVRTILDQARIPRHPRSETTGNVKRPAKQEPINGIDTEYLAGAGLNKLARRHHISAKTVRRMLKEKGIAIRPHSSARGTS